MRIAERRRPTPLSAPPARGIRRAPRRRKSQPGRRRRGAQTPPRQPGTQPPSPTAPTPSTGLVAEVGHRIPAPCQATAALGRPRIANYPAWPPPPKTPCKHIHPGFGAEDEPAQRRVFVVAVREAVLAQRLLDVAIICQEYTIYNAVDVLSSSCGGRTQAVQVKRDCCPTHEHDFDASGIQGSGNSGQV
jgi:hypothetical protein